MPIRLAAPFGYIPSEAIVRTVGKALAGTVAACKVIGIYGASGEAGAFQPVKDRHG